MITKEQVAESPELALYVESMACTLHVVSWDTWNEYRAEDGLPHTNTSGCELFSIAPDTPPECESAAAELLATIGNLSGEQSCEALAERLDGLACPDDTLDERDDLAHYLAMEALGHGVAWTDEQHRAPHGLKLPFYCEAFYADYSDDPNGRCFYFSCSAH